MIAQILGFIRKLARNTVVLILLVVVGYSSFVIVDPGERGIVVTLGKVEETVFNEGLSFKIPFVQSVKIMDVKTQKKEVQESSASKDLQVVTAKVAVNYNLEPDNVNKLYQKVGLDYRSRIIDPAVQEAIKAATAQYTAEELITRRAEVREKMQLLLSDKLAPLAITVTQLSIVDFDFSGSFNTAIEEKVTAEQKALAAKNKLEQVKFEAQQRIEQAQGEAEAIRIQVAAIREQGGAEYVQLKAIEAWDGKLPTQMLSNVVPFVNIQ